MNLPTSGQVIAAGRHVVTFVAGAATFAGAVHILNPDQAKSIVSGVTKVSEGLAEIFAVIGPIAAVVSGFFASRSASPVHQAAALANLPEVKKIVAAPDLAEAVPSDKVVTK